MPSEKRGPALPTVEDDIPAGMAAGRALDSVQVEMMDGNQFSAEHDQFEETWQRLQESGADGWGGASFGQRVGQWEIDLGHPLLRGLLNTRSCRVLEVGCGSGDVGALIAGQSQSVLGIDVAPTAIAWANKKWKSSDLNIEFRMVAAENVAAMAETNFDIIIDANCLHCLGGTQRGLALTGIAEKLASDGMVVISSMVLPVRDLADTATYDASSRRMTLPDGGWRHMASVEELCLELENADLGVLAIDRRSRSWWDHAVIFASHRC